MKLTLEVNDTQGERILNAFGVKTGVEFKKELMALIKRKVIAEEFNKKVAQAENEAKENTFELN